MFRHFEKFYVHYEHTGDLKLVSYWFTKYKIVKNPNLIMKA